MNDNMTISKSNIWGCSSNTRNVQRKIRLMKKYNILAKYPFVDHYNIYAYKSKTQKGKAREEQTFIVSYAYNYDTFADENTFINELDEIDLGFYKEKCLYRNMDAYKIIIYEKSLPIEIIKLYKIE